MLMADRFGFEGKEKTKFESLTVFKKFQLLQYKLYFSFSLSTFYFFDFYLQEAADLVHRALFYIKSNHIK